MLNLKRTALTSTLFISAVAVFFSLWGNQTQGIQTSEKKSRLELQWPVIAHKNVNISSTFGETRLDHFHNGVDIPGENLRIVPVESGQVILQKSFMPKIGEIPFGGGNTLYLRHKSFYSGYMHLKTFHDAYPKNNYAVEAKQLLGTTGNSGHSGGAHLHFFIYDLHQNRFYNPLLFLNDDHYHDQKNPQVKEFAVKLPTQTSLINVKKPFVLTTNHPLVASIIDSGKANERWGVYFLRTYHDRKSQPLVNLEFNFIQFHQQQWKTGNHLSFEEVYDNHYYILGKTFKNNPKLIIESGGYRGPSHSEEILLQIKDK